MGIFLTYARTEKIRAIVESFIEKKKLEKEEENDTPSKYTIKAAGEYYDKPARLVWEVEKYGHSSSIKMKVLPGKGLKEKIIAKNVIFLLLLPLIPFIFTELWKSGVEAPLNAKIAVIFPIIAGLLVMSDNKIKNVFKKIETDFRAFARNEVEIRIESPAKGNILPEWLNITIIICLFLLFVYVMNEVAPVLLFVSLPAFGLTLISIIMAAISLGDASLTWKNMIIENVFRWIIVTYSIIFAVFMLYTLNSIFLISYENSLNDEKIPLKNAPTIAYFEHSLGSRNEFFGNPIETRIRMIERTTAQDVNKLEEAGVTANGENINRLKYFRTAIIGLMTIFLAMIAVQSFLGKVSKIPEDWRLALAENASIPIKHPSVEYKSTIFRSAVFNILLIIWILFAFIINVCFTIFSIDFISFIFKGNALIVKELSILYSWIPTTVLFLSKGISYNVASVSVILSKLILLYFGLPFIFIIFKWIIRFLKRVLKDIRDNYVYSKRNYETFPDIVAFIDKASAKACIPKPILIISESSDVVVETRMKVFSRRAIIVVDKAVVEKLDKEEIAAIIGHEIGHIKYGLRNLSILKLISRLALFPNFFLTIFTNYRKSEEFADKFAIKVASKEGLRNALVKLSALAIFQKGLMRKGVNGGERTLRKKRHVADDFLFGEGLIGYSHPEVFERLRSIEEA